MRRWFAFLLLLGAPLGTFLAQGVPESGQVEGLDNTQVIKASDWLTIAVLRSGADPALTQVGSGGEVKPPLVKLMPATGVTCRALALNIQQELKRTGLGGTQTVLVKFATTLDFLDDWTAIKPGDNLNIKVFEERREPEQIKVTADGTIEVRHLGTIKVAGITSRKLAKLISQKLAAMPQSKLTFWCADMPTVAVIIDNIHGCGWPSMDGLDNSTKLQPLDAISILILEDPLGLRSLAQFIPADGVTRPQYSSSVQATGLTCRELAFKIKTELESTLFKKATVIVRKHPLPTPLLFTPASVTPTAISTLR